MKVVLDTIVLVSGLLTPHGPAAQSIRLVAAGNVQLVYDAGILTEYRSVLYRTKFGFNREKVDILLNHIEILGQAIASEPLNGTLPDEGDRPFLESAVISRVKYLVTGNVKHYPPDLCRGIEVVSPAEFLEGYGRMECYNRD
jgi:putative PIN family toxin of toxin-antitoxin system